MKLSLFSLLFSLFSLLNISLVFTFNYYNIHFIQKLKIIPMSLQSNPSLNANDNGELIFTGVHHFGFIVKDVTKAMEFYRDVLGLADISHLRHELPYPGAFLACGPQQLHLMQIPNPDEGTPRPEYSGRDKHVALAVNSIDTLAKRLDAHGVSYKLSKSGRKALFTRDYDENALEFVEV
jgi:glyoxylase I family protein